LRNLFEATSLLVPRWPPCLQVGASVGFCIDSGMDGCAN